MRCITGQTYQNDTLTPSSSPLTTNERDPFAVTPDALADRNLGIQLNAHTEVQLQRRGGDLKRSRDIALRESVKKIVGRNRVLHNTQVCGTLQQVLALATGVLGADLLTVDTLYRQTLYVTVSFGYKDSDMEMDPSGFATAGNGISCYATQRASCMGRKAYYWGNDSTIPYLLLWRGTLRMRHEHHPTGAQADSKC